MVARETFDGVLDITRIFPIDVVADLVGLPREGREYMHPGAEAPFAGFGPFGDYVQEHLPHLRSYHKWMATMADRSKLAPGGWGEAIMDAVDDGRLTQLGAIRTVSAYLTAGMDTTVNAIAALMRLFADRTDVWEALKADPRLAGPIFEEILRLEAPVSGFFRIARHDVTVGDVTVPAGAKVMLYWAAANRDPAKYADPDHFDITRNPLDHVAFGYGVHACAGQGLPRMQAVTLLEALATQIDTIHLTGDPVRGRNPVVRGYDSFRCASPPGGQHEHRDQPRRLRRARPVRADGTRHLRARRGGVRLRACIRHPARAPAGRGGGRPGVPRRRSPGTAVKHIVVAGGSIAAATAVSTLRAHGWGKKITLVTDEDTPPYSRVPLSKGVLTGVLGRDAVTLPALPDDVDVRLNTRAAALDVPARIVTLSDGTDLRYDGLVIATGSRPRRLAADGQHGELVVRSLADAAAIHARLSTARSAIVVGAGFLGMEVASTLRAGGLAVTVIDRDPPLRRLIGPWLAGIITDTATEAGVDFVLAPHGVILTGCREGAGRPSDRELAFGDQTGHSV